MPYPEKQIVVGRELPSQQRPPDQPAPTPGATSPRDGAQVSTPHATTTYRERLARAGYAYLRPFAEPVLAQLERGDLDGAERERLTARLTAMFAVSHSPDGHGLTDVKAASNRYHAELGKGVAATLDTAQRTADSPRAAWGAADRIARGLETQHDALLEDGVHLTVGLGDADAAERSGTIEARIRIAPNFLELLVPLLYVGGLGLLGYMMMPQQPPLELLPDVEGAGPRGRTAMDRRGGARGVAAVPAITQQINQSFHAAARAALGGQVAIAEAGGIRTVTPHGEDPFTVRTMVCPLGSRVMRPVINTSKEAHVLQISDQALDSDVERALAAGLAEIAGVQRVVRHHGFPSETDMLGRGDLATDVLSPRDLGALAQLEVLAREVVAAGVPNDERRRLRKEIQSLVDDLGLRHGNDDRDDRRAAIDGRLSDTARQALDDASAREDQLSRNQRRALHEARIEEGRARQQDRQEEHRSEPLHQVPRQGARITPAGARQLAAMAAEARRVKAEATLARYRQLAQAAVPNFHRVQDPQIGGGAALAAIRTGQLLIDDAGRWQRDGSSHLAQTAAQLHWVLDAGIGDPYEFVERADDRVPIEAVRYWEDTIAAQADLIEGRGRFDVDGQGRMLLRVAPRDGNPLVLEVAGNPVLSTGFPPENIPRPRAPDPAAAKQQLIAALQGQPNSGALLARMAAADPLDDGAWAAIVAGNDPLLAWLRGPGNQAAAMAVFDAATPWVTHHRPDNHGRQRVLTGDEANTDQLDPSAAAHWVITGVGGTGISAAEIILDKNRQARVTMIGGTPTPGLFDNVQARRVMDLYGPTGQGRFQVINGQDIGPLTTHNGGATFDAGGPLRGDAHLTAPPAIPGLNLAPRRWLVAANPTLLPAVRHICEQDRQAEAQHAGPGAFARVMVTIYGAAISQQLRDDDDFGALLEEFGPVSGTVRLQVATDAAYAQVNAAGGGFATAGTLNVDGYIAAIGRRGQSAPVIRELLAQAQAAGNVVAGQLLWDDDGQYLGYRITVNAPQGARSVEVTGASSRFLPEPPFGAVERQAVERAGRSDAPPESGNFDGGFAASAMQSARYGRHRRTTHERTQINGFQLGGNMGTLVLPAGQQDGWADRVAAFLAAELRVQRERVVVKMLSGGASGDAVFKVRVGEHETIFKVFDDTFGQAQNELDQLRFLAQLNPQQFRPVDGRQGRLPAQMNGQGQRSGILMEAAQGESVDQILENLPAQDSPLRAVSVARLRHAATRVATALAELHHLTSGGGNLTRRQKTGQGSDGANILGKVNQLQVDLGVDFAPIQAATHQALHDFVHAAIPATAYHGDANAGNFILDGDDVSIIDVGNLRWSHQGNQGTKTGANDLARFLTSLETLHPDAPNRLNDGELAGISDAFLASYRHQFNRYGHNVTAADLDAATRVYRVESEIAWYRAAYRKLNVDPIGNAQEIANQRARLRARLRGVLGI